MSFWKYSFDLTMRETELTLKKRQALNELLESGKISQSTHDYVEKELAEAMTDLQGHLDSLTAKMTSRAAELEKQIGKLELFLASAEIHHSAGDIDDESYQAQTKAILLGLETTRRELNDIKDSLAKMSPPSFETPTASKAEESSERTMDQSESEVSTIMANS